MPNSSSLAARAARLLASVRRGSSQKATSSGTNDLHGRLHNLSYNVYGDAAGAHTCFFVHGWPGSRVGGSMLHATAKRLGVRVVAADRPGFGGSAFWRGHDLRSWADAVTRLADALRADRYSVFGVSGGAPFAAACAAFAPPGRVAALGLLGPLGPLAGGTAGISKPGRALLAAARSCPPLARAAWAVARAVLRADADAVRRFSPSKSDRAALCDAPDAAAAIRAAVLEGLKAGSQGVVHEMAVAQRPWGFAPAAIAVPRALIWEGGADCVAPPALAAPFYAAIPGAIVRRFEGDGHTGLVVRRMQAALEELLVGLSGGGGGVIGGGGAAAAGGVAAAAV